MANVERQRSANGKPIILYLRDGTTTVTLTPRTDPKIIEEQGAIGIVDGGSRDKAPHLPGTRLAGAAVDAVYRHASALISLPGRLIRKEVPAEQGLARRFQIRSYIQQPAQRPKWQIGACLPRSVNVFWLFPRRLRYPSAV